MSDSKYYVPVLDDFHVTFEYECLSDGKYKKINNFTNAYDYEDSPIYGLQKDLDKGNIRVKFLDREDLESLGWVNATNFQDGIFFSKGDRLLFFNFKTHRLCITESIGGLILVGETKNTVYLFNGTIRNKSELKVLLKQLGL